jgi:hypothetical protein
MKLLFGFAVISAFCLVLLAAPEEKSPRPQYDAKGNLLRPADYRDWEFLSAGYGMNYSPAPGSHEMFTNVFVQRWAYEGFLKSGKWPEQSMFVIDERDAESKGSIRRDAGREKRTRFFTKRAIKNVVLDDILAIEPDARAKNGIALFLGSHARANCRTKFKLVFCIEKEPVRRAVSHASRVRPSNRGCRRVWRIGPEIRHTPRGNQCPLLVELAASESPQEVIASVRMQLRLRGRDIRNRPAFVLLYGGRQKGVDLALMRPGEHRCHARDLSALIDITSRDYGEVGILGD